MIGGGYVVERQGVSFRNGRGTKTQMIAGDKDPAPCAMQTCLATADRAGPIDGVSTSDVTTPRKATEHNWRVLKFHHPRKNTRTYRLELHATSGMLAVMNG